MTKLYVSGQVPFGLRQLFSENGDLRLFSDSLDTVIGKRLVMFVSVPDKIHLGTSLNLTSL